MTTDLKPDAAAIEAALKAAKQVVQECLNNTPPSLGAIARLEQTIKPADAGLAAPVNDLWLANDRASTWEKDAVRLFDQNQTLVEKQEALVAENERLHESNSRREYEIRQYRRPSGFVDLEKERDQFAVQVAALREKAQAYLDANEIQAPTAAQNLRAALAATAPFKRYDCRHVYAPQANNGRGCCDHPRSCHPPTASKEEA